MTAQMAYAYLTIEHGMTDGRANAIINKAMNNGSYYITSLRTILHNTNAGMPAEFRIEVMRMPEDI